MNTYSVHFTHGRSGMTTIELEAASSDEAWRLIQDDYAGQQCVLLDIFKID